MRHMLLLAVTPFLVGLFACSDIDPSRAEVGSPAPPYSALTLDGDSARLADLAGDVVLLNVWATWCEPCREEIPVLQALYEEHLNEGFTVVGVSVDGRGDGESIRRFAADFDMRYQIWHDPEDIFGPTFRTIGVPVTLLIDRDGIVRWRHMGPVEAGDTALTQALASALGRG